MASANRSSISSTCAEPDACPCSAPARAELGTSSTSQPRNRDGADEEAGFPSRLQMARFAGVNGGQYVYDVSTFYNEAAGAATPPTLELKDVVAESRWAIQVGIKINF